VPKYPAIAQILTVVIFSLFSSAAANAQPYAYVSNLSGNNVSVVNSATNAIVALISVPTDLPD
jgi:hypothetical protein